MNMSFKEFFSGGFGVYWAIMGILLFLALIAVIAL